MDLRRSGGAARVTVSSTTKGASSKRTRPLKTRRFAFGFIPGAHQSFLSFSGRPAQIVNVPVDALIAHFGMFAQKLVG